ncbi:MAG TPA: hypothetical protein VGG33_09115, partial [Polyangia bacterium]
ADAPRDGARDTLDAPAPDNAAATDTTALGRGLGEGCTAAAGCDSGHCVDGVCCESVCSGGCWSCAQPGHSGRCVAVPAGERDPRGQCAGEAAESCGNDGACDGAGACRKHAAGTVCRPGRCAETGERVLPALCDGAGACAPARTQSCAPFACAGDVCKTDCASAQDCARGVSCNAGSCGKRPLGAACSSGGDCNSGHCVDGVCCDVASCSGPCRACNLPGSAGSCQNFVANAVPRASGCSAEATSSCGRTGKCDGAGGCQLWTAGTPCRARSCAGTTESPASTCNGVGACVASNNRSCGAYSCAGDACATGCSNDSTCAAGNFCRMGACLPAQANGSTCSTGRECRSGFCVDGHCCGSSGCGANMACTGPGGTCIGRRQLGTACTTNGECVTGICADGVCCATACTDACRRCDGSPAGVCIPITSGRDSNASSPCVAPRRCEQGGVCR